MHNKSKNKEKKHFEEIYVRHVKCDGQLTTYVYSKKLISLIL